MAVNSGATLSKYFGTVNAPGFDRKNMGAMRSAADAAGVVQSAQPLKAAQGKYQNAVATGGDVAGAQANVQNSVNAVNGGMKQFIPGASSMMNTGAQPLGSGGIGSNPFGTSAATPAGPRSVETQIANRPAYQRNRVTTGQMSEMNRANQDRYRAEIKPLSAAFDRSLSQANAQQQMADTSINDSMANQFFGLMNGYQQQQNSLNQQQLMPLLSQLFGGF